MSDWSEQIPEVASASLLTEAIEREGCEGFLRRREYVHLFSQRRRQNRREDGSGEGGGGETPIAYSILVYKNTLQVERLLRAIYRPQN